MKTKLVTWSCSTCGAVGIIEKVISLEPKSAKEEFDGHLEALHKEKSPHCKKPDLRLMY
jgi:hypothetical protein